METINPEHFEILRKRYGNHSDAARALGLGPSHYRYIRRTLRMSSALRKFILMACGNSKDDAGQRHGKS